MNIAQLDALPVKSSEVIKETQLDPLLSKVLHYVKRGWTSMIIDGHCLFWRRYELALTGDCVLLGNGLVIPAKLQEIYTVEGTSPRSSRNGLYEEFGSEPCMVAKIDENLEACHGLPSMPVWKKASPRVPLHPWAWPTSPWQRVHTLVY